MILGSTIMVPSPAEAAAAMVAAGMTRQPRRRAGRAAPTALPPAARRRPQPLGGYTVRWGDTLSGLAAVARVPMEQIAAANGLDPAGTLLAGTVLKLPTGAPTPPRAAQPAPAPVVPDAAPQPTPGRASAEQIQSIAASHGVPGSLAAAIAWQESGFNNAMVSSANARGVMQIMPGTWTWIQETMAPGQLDPASVDDNVKAGSLYLNHLLRETGGDQAAAAAGLLPGPRLAALARHVRRHPAVRRQRPGVAVALRRLRRPRHPGSAGSSAGPGAPTGIPPQRLRRPKDLGCPDRRPVWSCRRCPLRLSDPSPPPLEPSCSGASRQLSLRRRWPRARRVGAARASCSRACSRCVSPAGCSRWPGRAATRLQPHLPVFVAGTATRSRRMRPELGDVHELDPHVVDAHELDRQRAVVHRLRAHQLDAHELDRRGHRVGPRTSARRCWRAIDSTRTSWTRTSWTRTSWTQLLRRVGGRRRGRTRRAVS